MCNGCFSFVFIYHLAWSVEHIGTQWQRYCAFFGQSHPIKQVCRKQSCPLVAISNLCTIIGVSFSFHRWRNIVSTDCLLLRPGTVSIPLGFSITAKSWSSYIISMLCSASVSNALAATFIPFSIHVSKGLHLPLHAG